MAKQLPPGRPSVALAVVAVSSRCQYFFLVIISSTIYIYVCVYMLYDCVLRYAITLLCIYIHIYIYILIFSLSANRSSHCFARCLRVLSSRPHLRAAPASAHARHEQREPYNHPYNVRSKTPSPTRPYNYKDQQVVFTTLNPKL